MKFTLYMKYLNSRFTLFYKQVMRSRKLLSQCLFQSFHSYIHTDVLSTAAQGYYDNSTQTVA